METSHIKTYENPEFGKVRTIVDDRGEPWFVGKDVADNLGYQNGSRDINRHVENEDRKKIMIHDGNQMKETIIINESGLYSLILSSKLPSAKKFKLWVTRDILPSIRKHGAYMTPETIEKVLTNPDFIIRLATELKDEQKRNQTLRKQNEELKLAGKVKDQQIEEFRPKATYYDVVLQTKDAIAITKIAKDYGMSGRKLNNILYEHHVQYKQGKIWLLYQEHADKGYTQTKTDIYTDEKGTQHSSIRTCWTQKGRLFIYQLLKESGILPIIERKK